SLAARVPLCWAPVVAQVESCITKRAAGPEPQEEQPVLGYFGLWQRSGCGKLVTWAPPWRYRPVKQTGHLRPVQGALLGTPRRTARDARASWLARHSRGLRKGRAHGGAHHCRRGPVSRGGEESVRRRRFEGGQQLGRHFYVEQS